MANWLLEKKMAVAGTIKRKHKGDSDLKRIEDIKSQNTKVYWEKDKVNNRNNN